MTSADPNFFTVWSPKPNTRKLIDLDPFDVIADQLANEMQDIGRTGISPVALKRCRYVTCGGTCMNASKLVSPLPTQLESLHKFNLRLFANPLAIGLT